MDEDKWNRAIVNDELTNVAQQLQGKVVTKTHVINIGFQLMQRIF
jgi:hypothetical protein